MNSELKRLIDDTLHGRRFACQSGSCLVTNEAGNELASLEADITTDLESTIREIEESSPGNPKGTITLAGLEYLLGAYLINAAKYDAKRCVDFIESCQAAMVQQFLANMPVFFRRMDVGYNFGVEPPAEYVELARKLKDSRDKNVAATAIRVFERLTKRSR